MNSNKDLKSLTKKELEDMFKENKIKSKEDLIKKFGLPYNAISFGLISGLLERYGLFAEYEKLDILNIRVESEEEANEILEMAAKMGITINETQLELNRAWIYGEDYDEPIGETNFVINKSYLESILPKITSDSLDDFLDVYEPETDGEKIYQMAIVDKKIIEDMGKVYY